MLNKLWPWMIVVSIIFAVISGRINDVNNAIFSSLENTTTTIISLIGVMCFWSGIIKILVNTNIIKKIQKILKPLINRIYKSENDETRELITINMVSNMMGIGNAATPAGIKAMKKMDNENKGENMTKSMKMFLLMNCLSIQILPSTIMSIMASQGVENVGRIIIPIWIVSIIVFVVIMGVGTCLFQE